MRRNLPPFASLRAFEAAARHESFKAAAEELNLTQSAVSHQIKALEECLGLSLFQRRSGGVFLSPKGKRYFQDVCAALDRIADATNRTSAEGTKGVLFISATPAFTSRWLMPRLLHFSGAHPDIELNIIPNNAPLRFPDDETDILIQYGSEPSPGFTTEPFLHTTRFPVCSPSFLEREGIPQSPRELAHKTLLRDEFGDAWGEWFLATGEGQATEMRGPRLAHCELTLRAAIEGQGIALAYEALIEKELQSGELVRLFHVETSKQLIYSMMYPEGQANHPRIAAFRSWIFDQVNQIANAS